ncbi:MAG: peptide chain release factor 2 [Deltaproteobacteria bacterium]|nr:peptide chain release factor 2 [Deltaproteobacteria bacterium]
MYNEQKNLIAKLDEKRRALWCIFDVDAKRVRIAAIDQEMARPEFWGNTDAAARIQKERTGLLAVVETFDAASREIDDARALLDLAEAESDDAVAEGILSDLAATEDRLAALEFRRMLSDEHDGANAIVSINSGAGGTESQDWAQMLLRMYLRWAERKGFATEVVDTLYGEEAGIKNVTVIVRGSYAFGYLKAEVGVHRLVRISPFDSNARRHTSFASVAVIPEIDDEIKIDIPDTDLRIDVFRSGGPGGQGVNTTDSAVRITYLPTNIVVVCQNERSQHKNKALAMKILRARLYEMEEKKREEEMEKLHREKKKIEWGSQIRSYVLQPYRLAKDHRTGHEVGNVDAVLDGDLDAFIKAFLLAN